MECIYGQSLILCTVKSATTSAPARIRPFIVCFAIERIGFIEEASAGVGARAPSFLNNTAEERLWIFCDRFEFFYQRRDIATFRSRSHDAVIRVYDEAGNVVNEADLYWGRIATQLWQLQ
jgi:hypothetical protein